jgi:glycosyltransferase involved in cell wall biosynthesis
VLISDGSTDRTNQIAKYFADQNEFITFIIKGHSEERDNFPSKIAAIQLGYKELVGLDYEYIGILDADLSFSSVYFERLTEKFIKNEKLGIGGGFIYERRGGTFRRAR